MIFEILVFACPLLLASAGALYSEYTGTLALYLEGSITLSAFLTFALTVITHNFILASFLTTLIISSILLFCGWIIEKYHGNVFITSLGLNLLFAGLSSFLSAIIFKTPGVLSSPLFAFNKTQVILYSIIITVILISVGGYVLFFTQKGVYFRTTGSDADVLKVKGINISNYKIASWSIAGLFASQAGTLLAMRVSSFVPNISAGRGWMALAAVYLGKKKLWKIIAFALLFCGADYLGANIQNFIPGIPSSLLLALPYLAVLLLSLGLN